MRSIDEAAGLVMRFLFDELKLDPAQVVWYGRSIGSGPVMRVAHRILEERQLQPGGLVIQCGFANFKDVVGHLFGSLARRLAGALWPNEKLLRGLHCPVLLIHGRVDTMIPFEQSERLWDAVSYKALSKYHACDCGHNDFSFQRNTLRPIHDFLNGVISAENYPTSNFVIEAPAESRARVRHLGPLWDKIPAYSFRRPEVEKWLRQVMQRSAQEPAPESAQANDADARRRFRSKKKVPEPPPDVCGKPPIETIAEAFGTAEGLLLTCTHRVAAFLERLQRNLVRIEGLESRPIVEVVEFVEAEFWASDPLLCLWEEVRVPGGERISLRLGPFFVDSSGARGYDAKLRAGSESANLLCIPLWNWCPSPTQFRYLAEWSLLNSERLQQSLSKNRSLTCGSGGGCLPCRLGSRRGAAGSGRQSVASPTFSKSSGPLHLSRGAFATSVAAHFVEHVDKNEEVKAMFARFVSMYQDAGEKRDMLKTFVASHDLQPGAPDILHGLDSERADAPPQVVDDTQQLLPAAFSAKGRYYLMEDAGFPGSELAAAYRRLWEPIYRSMSPLKIDDFSISSTDVAALSEVQPTGSNCDLMVGCVLLHYATLCSGAPCAEPSGSVRPEGGPLRAEVHATGRVLCKLMRHVIADIVAQRSPQRHKQKRQEDSSKSNAVPAPRPMSIT